MTKRAVNPSSPHQHHHYHPAKLGPCRSRPSELISSEALNRVVFPLKKRLPQQEELEDSLGDQLTRALNASPCFHVDLSRVRKIDEDRSEPRNGFTICPLICRCHNPLALCRAVLRLRTASPMALFLSIVDLCYQRAPNDRKMWPTMARTMSLFSFLAVTGILFVFMVSHFSLKWGGYVVSWIVIHFAILLTDCKDSEVEFPSQFKKLSGVILCLGRWTDRHLFLRKRFGGREWNRNEFEFEDTTQAESRHTQLWNLPPPCVHEAGKQLCLDPRYMGREEWSNETSRHVVAINFSYIMMRENHQGRRAFRCTTLRHEYKAQAPLKQTGGRWNAICSSSKAPLSPAPQEEELENQINHREVMSLSTKLGTRTEHVLGLTNDSPSGGIELVRENDGVLKRLRTSYGFSVSSVASMEEPLAAPNCKGIVHTSTQGASVDSDCSPASSVASCSSAAAADMNWVDISARIGRRVLNSSHLQRAVASQEAAERLKNITDQLVANPKDGNADDEMRFVNSFTSPFEMQSSNASPGSRGQKFVKVLQRQSCSPCRPVHSMWTSAAAAATDSSSCSNDEYNFVASLDLAWKGRQLSGACEGSPTAPPRIIRTRVFPSTPAGKRSLAPSISPLRDIENSRAFAAEKQEQSTDTFESKANLPLGESVSETAACPLLLPKHECGSRHFTPPGKRWISRSNPHGDLYPATQKMYEEREPLAPGVRVAAPLIPLQPGRRRVGNSNYQMATVVSSRRVFVNTSNAPVIGRELGKSNCLSVKCKIDKSFMRNGEFAELTFRVLDEWGSRYLPKHSKVPIGACVATTFGVGVLVGWRVEDDCHVIRSLWQRRGPGTAHAYLRRDAIHGVVEAAIGFDVQTKCGSGKVLGYVDAGRDNLSGRFVVALQDDGVYKDCVVALNRAAVHACYGAQFIPIIAFVEEACDYQIMLDNYKAVVGQQRFTFQGPSVDDDHNWKCWSENLDIVWKSFLRAADEDIEFDEGVDNFMGQIIDFLERLDRAPVCRNSVGSTIRGRHEERSARGQMCVGLDSNADNLDCEPCRSVGPEEDDGDFGFWILSDLFGGFLPSASSRQAGDNASVDKSEQVNSDGRSVECSADYEARTSYYYKRAYAVIRIMMKTCTLASSRAAIVGKHQFCLAMTTCREFLMFIRTLIKVQQKNVSPHSLKIWRAALDEIMSTFGPLKDRIEKVGMGIAQRIERQGRRAKIRVLRFADSVIGDEQFFIALCQGEWKQCLARIESAMVKTNIIDEASSEHYRRTVLFIYEHIRHLSSRENDETERNNEKLVKLGKVAQILASPKRSVLKLIKNDDLLNIFERILVRVFCREEIASRALTIHASNFKSLRHLRILKDLSVSGRLWIPLLDAADEEFSYVVSRMPENAKELMCPLSSIFSLCVAQFHKISEGHSTKDWLDFLMEEDGVRIIHDLQERLIVALSSFSRDIRKMMLVTPYYPSIDDDILNLMDEVEVGRFLEEASEAIDDADKLAAFIRDKAATAIERFLAYLPKLSVPVERRELGDGWVLTCHGQNGGDLTLSDVKSRRENLVCEVMGRDALFLPMFCDDDGDGDGDGDDDNDRTPNASSWSVRSTGDCLRPSDSSERSVLDTICDMIVQAHRQGSWTVGVGGVGQPPSDHYVSSVIPELPLTTVLNCAIDLWRNLEIDDDELLEIAIRDVSFQIQVNSDLEKGKQELGSDIQPNCWNISPSSCLQSSISGSASLDETMKRFNPRVDPTVLLLEMKNVSLHLERFRFRIEKGAKSRTVFDPVFEGCGMVSVENLNVFLRVEVARERIGKVGLASAAPVLVLRDLEVEIEDVHLMVKDTGADWLLNKAVKGFSESITDVVECNLKEQIQEQTRKTLERLNSYFLVNEGILLRFLGISLEDLEEHIVWV